MGEPANIHGHETAQQQPPYMQSFYERMMGATVFGERTPIMLEWGADNIIRIYTNQVGQKNSILEKELHPRDIKSFGIYIGQVHLTLRSGEKYYLLPPDSDKVRLLMAGPLAGVIMGGPAGMIGAASVTDKTAADIENSSDAIWWAQALAPYGVKIHRKGSDWMHRTDKKIWIITGVTIAVLFFFFLIGALASSAVDSY